MTREELKRLAHPSEFSRFLLTLFVVVPIGIILIFLTIGTLGLVLLVVPVILFFFWFGTSILIAGWMNNMVKVSPDNFPEVHDYVALAKDTFNYHRGVDAYVYEDGSYNAAMVMLLRKRVILLNSELLVDPEFRTETKFIVGRFVGALAAKHHRFLWFEVLINSIENLLVFNIFLMPYERAVQYSGDQLGLYFINGDLKAGLRALLKCMVGRELADQVNIDGVLRQELETRGRFFVWLARMLSPFPHMTSRMANLLRFGHEVFPAETQRFSQTLPNTSKTAKQIFPSPNNNLLTLKCRNYTLSPLLINRSIQVGRTEECELYIGDGSVSRKHAMIEPAGEGQISVTDLGSSNGTYVNGLAVRQATLKAGDIVQFGDAEFDVTT